MQAGVLGLAGLLLSFRGTFLSTYFMKKEKFLMSTMKKKSLAASILSFPCAAQGLLRCCRRAEGECRYGRAATYRSDTTQEGLRTVTYGTYIMYALIRHDGGSIFPLKEEDTK